MREPGEAAATQVGCYRSSMPTPAPITLTVSARRRRALLPQPAPSPRRLNPTTLPSSRVPVSGSSLWSAPRPAPSLSSMRPTLRPCARPRTTTSALCGAAEAAHGRRWGGSRLAEWALPRIRTGAAYMPSSTLPVAGCLGDSDSQQLVPRQQRPQQAPWRWAVEVDANSTT
jgi:hypothetical protein